MGCLEAMCESWMAAMGKAYADKQVRDVAGRRGWSPSLVHPIEDCILTTSIIIK